MNTILQKVIKEIAELWSSPSDQPTYTQIMDILERNEPLFKQQIIEAFIAGDERGTKDIPFNAEQYYNETFQK